MGYREDWLRKLSPKEREIEAEDAFLLDRPEDRGSLEDYRRRFLLDLDEEDAEEDPDPRVRSPP